ncbi:hypothetical protein MY04_1127 [Flammeovirga sp. MY04]|uniref:DUF6588 family protein n=1 Tax=Flammeovirga sp. MY04 TaxID=1191459 RepID=UPI0013053BC3|nr:DUF6588 family protein [Flammeovirga sp. MY04]ANQ48504.2 hypothetical protein MY04_1127 [Flammeovirga sp. MY04]
MKKLLLLIVVISCSHPIFSQDVLSLFATKGPMAQQRSLEVFRRYATPLSQSYAWSTSLGWMYTARPHRPIGFDISISNAGVILPDNALYYRVDDIQGVRVISGDNSLPTFFGSDTQESVIGIMNDDGSEAVIPATRGININYALLPSIKFGLGVGKNTELIGRLFPKVEYNGIVVKMWGTGIKHNIAQWFFKEKSPFDLSLFAGYTQLEGQYPLQNSQVAPVVDPGFLQFETKGGNFECMLSKTFPLLTIYTSAGYVYTKNETLLNGNYTLLQLTEESLNIPTDGVLDIYRLQSWKFSAGLMFKIGLVYINGDYTYGWSHQINVGLGLTLK